MKLFSRDSQTKSDEEFDDVVLPTKDDLNDSFFVEEVVPAVAAPRKKQVSYDIEDAIQLMRTLPKESTELVVMVVNKTLQSINIEVADIIKSAEDKEKRIREQNKSLEREVHELEAKIANRNEEMAKITADLRETMEVKKRLRLALELEVKLNRATQKTEPEMPRIEEPAAVPVSEPQQ